MTRVRAVLCSAAIGAAACASAIAVRLPEGPWAPDPAAAEVFQAASAACRGVRTLTAEIAVRGQAGQSRVRGRVLAGFERGGAVRLEAPAPFGAPVFILAARANRATLWLPREKRVLRDAPVEDVLEAITGLPRSGDDLLALVAGCLTAAPAPVGAGRSNPRGWMAVDLADATSVFLARDGGPWRIAAGRRDGGAALGSWSVSYSAFTAGFPASITVRQDRGGASPGPPTVLALQVSQLETNVPIESRAFEVTIPADAQALTLDELRQSGPLAEKGSAT